MKNYLLKSVVILSVCIGLSTAMSAQEVIQVAAGPEAIGQALLDAFPGDIIELTTSGGLYTDTAGIVVEFDLTIRAAEGLEYKPIITANHDDDFFYMSGGGLTLQGIKFDAKLDGTPRGNNIVYWKVTTETVESTDFSLRVDNCEFHNFVQRAISCSDGTLVPVDSVIITNSIFMNGIKQGVYLKSTRGSSDIFPGSYKYCLIENCLFKGLTSSGDGHATYLEPGNREVGDQGWPKVIVNHVTVDSCYHGISTYTTPGALVQNSIVTNLLDSTRACFDVEGGRWTTPDLPPPSMLKNCIYSGGYIDLTGSSTVVAVTENVDSIAPQFVDAANEDYTLVADSPGTAAATDGTDLGYSGPGPDPELDRTGVKQMKYNSAVHVYPNPASETVYITLGREMNGASKLEIFDVSGKVVLRMDDLGGQKDINVDLSSVSPGLYFGLIQTEADSHSFKILKK